MILGISALAIAMVYIFLKTRGEVDMMFLWWGSLQDLVFVASLVWFGFLMLQSGAVQLLRKPFP